MRTSLIVKEFDEIINKDNKKPWMSCHDLPSQTFNDLKIFIEEFNTSEIESDILDFMRIGYKRDYGDVITVRNYVGLIQMKDGTQIEILPKIANQDNNAETKKIFLSMLRTLKEFSGKVFNSSSLNTDRMNLYEIFINMYLQEVRYLINKGVKSFYERKEENLNVFKGKLNVREQINKNLLHKEKFYIEYDEYTVNRPENRLIKSTLLKLQKLSNYIENIKEIRNLLNSFEFIDESKNYDKDFSQVVIDRSNKEYENLMDWSRVFLYNKSFTTFSGSTAARSLLFPMEKVFESFVANELMKSTRDKQWEISTQDRGLFLFDSPEKFSLRPDIVIRLEDDEVVVMDTKWKVLVNDEGRNYGVSQADMYQMYAYAKKYNTKKVIVIYPLNTEMRETVTFISDDGVEVNLFFIDLNNTGQSINKLINLI